MATRPFPAFTQYLTPPTDDPGRTGKGAHRSNLAHSFTLRRKEECKLISSSSAAVLVCLKQKSKKRKREVREEGRKGRREEGKEEATQLLPTNFRRGNIRLSNSPSSPYLGILPVQLRQIATLVKLVKL